MKKAIVIGSGAGGATVAKELQGKMAVTVLEAGKPFQPFDSNLAVIEKLKKTGAFFDEKLIECIFPFMQIGKTADRMVLVKGKGTGGTTTLSAGNRLRQDRCLKEIGINLDPEFEELAQEIPESLTHPKIWHEPTHQVFKICQEMGLQPVVTPKMADANRCTGCGRCVLGCRAGVKWDSRRFLDIALKRGAGLRLSCRVRKVEIRNGRVSGVETNQGFLPADLVILAAGGLGTPVILQNSGIDTQPNLFVDPVLCVAARVAGARQNQEISMPFVIQRPHFIISPYFDFLSFFFNRKWRYPSGDIFSLMIKLADTNAGKVSSKRVQKVLTKKDQENLNEGTKICCEIFRKWGIKEENLFRGTLNAGHPGGMLPLTAKESQSFHHHTLPENLYVADATLFPHSLGNPPILTIAAMAKRVARQCLRFA